MYDPLLLLYCRSELDCSFMILTDEELVEGRFRPEGSLIRQIPGGLEFNY